MWTGAQGSSISDLQGEARTETQSHEPDKAGCLVSPAEIEGDVDSEDATVLAAE